MEVVSGLNITINGWISSDNMVTMTITASVTERGSSGSSDSAPPETFERVVTSSVRTPAGVPLAISGLIQRKKSVNKSKIPFLGDILLIGFLFTKTVESDEETQFTIYIVPRLVGTIASCS
ncbi:MAG: type II and III secretion system protein [Rhodopseudomonas palustris]|nr:type II and III secretion system protein [Rhodopseudomonas palustris]